MNFFINFLELIGALVFCFFVLTSLGRFFLHICLTKEKNQIDKAKTELNWSPKTSFKDMVQAMVNNDINLLK